VGANNGHRVQRDRGSARRGPRVAENQARHLHYRGEGQRPLFLRWLPVRPPSLVAPNRVGAVGPAAKTGAAVGHGCRFDRGRDHASLRRRGQFEMVPSRRGASERRAAWGCRQAVLGLLGGWAHSSVGQSTRLIPAGSRVQVLVGPSFYFVRLRPAPRRWLACARPSGPAQRTSKPVRLQHPARRVRGWTSTLRRQPRVAWSSVRTLHGRAPRDGGGPGTLDDDDGNRGAIGQRFTLDQRGSQLAACALNGDWGGGGEGSMGRRACAWACGGRRRG
jgi:hypothetical protein